MSFSKCCRTLLKRRAQNRFISLQRCERLEDQLHDLTDLHQHETANLKQELASIEEKVAYQAYERSRDIQVPPPSHQSSRELFPAVHSFNKPIHYTQAWKNFWHQEQTFNLYPVDPSSSCYRL